ncbi:MAG: hypothetical protein EBS01_15655, partial [Verrucomicrobia bacterium]|nr:hypothetical protein [Verrucomicrobiota bacterium]
MAFTLTPSRTRPKYRLRVPGNQAASNPKDVAVFACEAPSRWQCFGMRLLLSVVLLAALAP